MSLSSTQEIESGPYVLIVDDDVDLRAVLCDLLESHGWHAVAVDGGRAALAHLGQAAPPLLIVLDFEMPDMNGAAVLAALQAAPAWSRIPVVLSTARRDLPAVPGLLAVLEKPIDVERLMGLVEDLAAQRRAVEPRTGSAESD